jgi:hypothetical protein
MKNPSHPSYLSHDLTAEFRRALRARTRTRALARAAVVLRDILFALALGVLLAAVGTLWFLATALVLLFAGHAGSRYLRNHH